MSKYLFNDVIILNNKRRDKCDLMSDKELRQFLYNSIEEIEKEIANMKTDVSASDCVNHLIKIMFESISLLDAFSVDTQKAWDNNIHNLMKNYNKDNLKFEYKDHSGNHGLLAKIE